MIDLGYDRVQFDENDEEDIPLLPGVYCFWLSPYRYHSLGLTEYSIEGGKVCPKKIKKILLKKVSSVEKLLSTIELGGTISTLKKSSVLKDNYQIRGMKVQSKQLFDVISELPDSQVLDYVKLINKSDLMSIPIYVGITTHQTLWDRYFQHKRSYTGELEKNNFGSRFRKMGLQWRDLVFSCYSESYISSERNYRILEQHLHAMLNPILSIK